MWRYGSLIFRHTSSLSQNRMPYFRGVGACSHIMTVEPQIGDIGSRSDPTLHHRIALLRPLPVRRGSVVVRIPGWHADDLASIAGPGLLYVRCKNMALNIRDCVNLCISDDTLQADGPFYMVLMPGE